MYDYGWFIPVPPPDTIKEKKSFLRKFGFSKEFIHWCSNAHNKRSISSDSMLMPHLLKGPKHLSGDTLFWLDRLLPFSTGKYFGKTFILWLLICMIVLG